MTAESALLGSDLARREGAAAFAGERLDAAALGSEPLIGLTWIRRLRWGMLVSQIAALAVARYVLHIHLPLFGSALLLAIGAASNALLWSRVKENEGARHVLGGLLLVDVASLTALLSWSGGAANPFSALYIVYVSVAALLLGRAWALAMVALTSLAFGALFWVPDAWLGPHAHHIASAAHLQGMWAAYALSACFVAYFVSRVATALRRREHRIRDLQRYAASRERLASLSTMAAGAAHELGTPLSCIAVSATEIAEALAGRPDGGGAEEEARLIRQEVNRCREILDRLAMKAGDQAGEVLAWTPLGAILDELRAGLGPAAAARVRFDAGAHAAERIRCPSRTLVQVLSNLVRNGLDATRAAGGAEPVELGVHVADGRARFVVEDRGVGLSDGVRTRLGEPFFTTKGPGEGMGLGIYLVREFAAQVGGEFRIENRADRGARATLTLGTDPLETREAHVR